MRISIVVIASLALVSCQTVQHATLSGKPEVTVSASVDQVKSAFAGAMINAGYSIKTDSTLIVVAERDSNNPIANALLSSRYDARVVARITGTFLASGPQTRVLAEMTLVTNPGSAFERPTAMTNSPDSASVQALLNRIRDGFAAGERPDKVAADAGLGLTERRMAAGGK